MSDSTAPLATKPIPPFYASSLLYLHYDTVHPTPVSNCSSQGNEMYTVAFPLVSTCSMIVQGHFSRPFLSWKRILDSTNSHCSSHSPAPFQTSIWDRPYAYAYMVRIHWYILADVVGFTVSAEDLITSLVYVSSHILYFLSSDYHYCDQTTHGIPPFAP
jgi:hypothetical protein